MHYRGIDVAPPGQGQLDCLGVGQFPEHDPGQRQRASRSGQHRDAQSPGDQRQQHSGSTRLVGDLRTESRCAATTDDRGVDHRIATRITDETLRAQIGHGDDRFDGEAMVRGNGQDQRFHFQHTQFQIVAPQRRPQHAQVQTARAQPVALFGGEQVGVDLQGDVGQFVLQPAGHPGQMREGGGPGETHPDLPEPPVGNPADPAHTVLDGVQDALRLAEQEFPGRGERDLPGGAGEQRRAEFGLELPDRLRQGGLGHAQAFGGPAEVSGVRDGREVPQVTKFHLRVSFRCTATPRCVLSHGRYEY